MRFRYLMLAVALCGCIHSKNLAADDKPDEEGQSQQAFISIRICEQENKDAKVKVLSQPTIFTTTGRPFSLVIGGEIKRTNGEGYFQIGTMISGTLHEAEGDKLRFIFDVETSSEVEQGDDPDTELVRRSTVEVDTIVSLGKAKRIQLTPNRWYEFQVRYLSDLDEQARRDFMRRGFMAVD